MKRYKIVTYKNDPVKRNIPQAYEALRLAVSLSRAFQVKKSFHVRVDWAFMFANTVSFILCVLYAPVYYLGVLIVLVARCILALGYLLILKRRAAINVLKFMFTWQQ